MQTKELFLRPSTWRRTAQVYVGLFFLAAAYVKSVRALFGPAAVPLDYIFKAWLEKGLPIAGYREFMQFMMPYADILSIIVIICQAVAGALLVYNARLRWAGLLLFFSTVNIFLATYHNPALNWITGVAIWLGAFYMLRDHIGSRGWRLLSYAFLFLVAYYLYDRHNFGDGKLSAVIDQRRHYEEFVMALTPHLKQWYLHLLDRNPLGTWMWAGTWWAQVLCVVGMLTRYRLHAAIALMFIILYQLCFWLSAFSAEGTIMLIGLMTWATEEYWRQTDGTQHSPSSMLSLCIGKVKHVWHRLSQPAEQPLFSPSVLRTIVRDPWSLFFAVVCVIILVTMAAPGLFRLQNVGQWGGFSLDNRCSVDLFSANPHKAPQDEYKSQHIVAGSGTRAIGDTPRHNRQTCLYWAKSLCGTQTSEDWTVQWVTPSFKQQQYLQTSDICGAPIDTLPWFSNE